MISIEDIYKNEIIQKTVPTSIYGNKIIILYYFQNVEGKNTFLYLALIKFRLWSELSGRLSNFVKRQKKGKAAVNLKISPKSFVVVEIAGHETVNSLF